MSAARGALPRPAGRAADRLTAGAAYNLIGQAAPLAVAYFAIPVLTRELGAARFGLLTLVWAVLGYFTLFDLGLGRALTQAVAERLGRGRDAEVPALVWTGLALMLALGVVGGALLLALAPWLSRGALSVPPALQHEALVALAVLALSIPVVIVSAAVRGVLEAAGRFDLVNAVRVPQGVFSFAGPVLVLPVSRSLTAITVVLLVGRLAATLAWYVLMLRVLPALGQERRVRRAAAAPLLRFGSWLTVSNLVSPLMVTLDRFVIGAAAGVAAVAYYTAPWEAVTKLWIVPGAVGAVLFPAFAAAAGRGDAPDAARLPGLYAGGVKAVVAVLLPPVVLVAAFAPELLAAWLGAEYAERSAAVLRWLAVGVLFNSIAQIPFALVQAAGRPDAVARLHLVELPAYLLLLWVLVARHGIDGAAAAWTIRVALDAAALLVLARRVAPTPAVVAVRGAGVLAAAAGAAVALSSGGALPGRLALAAALLAVGAAAGWRLLLSADERAWLRLVAARASGRRGARSGAGAG